MQAPVASSSSASTSAAPVERPLESAVQVDGQVRSPNDLSCTGSRHCRRLCRCCVSGLLSSQLKHTTPLGDVPDSERKFPSPQVRVARRPFVRLCVCAFVHPRVVCVCERALTFSRKTTQLQTVASIRHCQDCYLRLPADLTRRRSSSSSSSELDDDDDEDLGCAHAQTVSRHS